MVNPYYTPSGTPGQSSSGSSAAQRSEFALVGTAFDKLPTTLTPNCAVVVNAGGTGMTVTTGTLALAGNFATTGAFGVTLAAGAAVTLTLPLVSGTLATLLGTETFSNKVAIGIGMVPVNILDITQSGANAGSRVAILNGNAGNAAYSEFRAINNSGHILEAGITSSTYTPSGVNVADGAFIASNGVGGLAIYTSGASQPVRIGVNNVEVARGTALGIQVGPIPGRALLQGNYNDALGAGGTLDIDTGVGAASWAGTISVCHANASNASNRTQGVYAIEGRGTTFSTSTILNTPAGTGAAFTISVPSNGVIRLTNTSGAVTFASMSFTGTQGA